MLNMLQKAGSMGTEMCFQRAKTMHIAGTMGTEMRFQCAKTLQIAGTMGTEMCFQYVKHAAKSRQHGYLQ